MPLTPIRLADVPFEQRMSAAREAARDCHTPKEAHELLAAALFPSERVYWVRSEVAEQRAAA